MLGKTLSGLAAATMLFICASGLTAQPPGIEAKAESSQLTGAKIVSMLEAMGYEAKALKGEKDEVVGASFTYRGRNYNYPIIISLSPNNKWVWITVWLKKLPDPKVPAAKLRELMIVNDRIGPMKFTYHERDNYFRVQAPIFNQNIRAVDIRNMVQTIDRALVLYASAWDPDKWSGGSE